MAKKENKYKGYGLATQEIHTGTDYDEGTGEVRRPLHMANSYKLPDDLSQVNYSSTDLLMYSQNGNPNQHWLEEKIAALHEADDAIVLASGVAALHLLKSGKMPCEWTGKKTRCYKIKKENVIAYLENRKVFPESYSAPAGWYKGDYTVQMEEQVPPIVLEHLRLYYTELLSNYPDC